MSALADKSPFYLDGGRAFAQRENTMSLDIIRPKDIPRGKIMFPKDEMTSLKTQDIPTAQPTYHHLKYLDKPDLCVGSTDPEHVGARARTYYAPMDRRARDLSLTTADIELAQPRSNKQKGNRHTDPTCPNYELPTCYKPPVTPPRHNGRLTNDCSDIELAHPKKVIPDRNYHRDPNEGRDIEFASANYQERMARFASRGVRQERQLDVKDINGSKRILPRCSNPLDPQYVVPTHATTSLHTIFSEEPIREEGPKVADSIGMVHGSKPRKLQWDNGEPHFSLLREDIAGTVPQRWIGSIPANIYDHPEVRPAISFHDPHDIPGAQVGSLKKGIEGATRRQLNPLNPHYPMLDGTQRPQPIPLLEAERGHPRANMGAHPMLKNTTIVSNCSTPSLRQQQQPQQSSRTPPDLTQSKSMPTLKLPGSRGGSDAGSRGFQPMRTDQVGNTIRIDDGAGAMMSRRSVSSTYSSRASP